MGILDDLLASLTEDAPVRSVLVGAHWTLVRSRCWGLASTLVGNKPHGHERVRAVGQLEQKTARELAEYARSDNLLEASIGVAAINSLLKVDEKRVASVNAGDVLQEKGRGRRVALIGHFPFISELRQKASELWVLEQRPVEGEYAPEAAADVIPQADVVAITGMTLINHTLDSLMELCRPDALVMVLGPSTPFSAVLFDHGAAMLSGAAVVDGVAAGRTISQGAIFPQVEGVQLWTVERPSGIAALDRGESRQDLPAA